MSWSSYKRRVLFYGGRDFADKDAVRQACEATLRKYGPFIMVNGMCPTGADAHAAEWVAECGVHGQEIEKYPADWNAHGRAAGPIRNKEMADSGLNGAVEFPGGRGTSGMRALLDERDIPVWSPARG